MLKESKEYYIGTSGWNYEHWKGRFYPEDLPRTKWFDFYAENFNTVEVNYSFYRWPNKDTFKRWHQSSPKNFKFTLKAPRTITHIHQLKDTDKWVRDFYKLAGLLEEKLACILFQLPPSFKFNKSNFGRLGEFIELLDKERENVIEFRNASWWNKKTYDLLRDRVIFCIVSGLGMPEDIVLTRDVAYFRFHGVRYSTNYSSGELRRYSKNFKELKCKKVYAYFNNDANAFAVKNSLELKRMLGR